MTAPSKLISTTFKFAQRPNASLKGAFEVVPRLFIFKNTGLSANCSRIHRETASKMADTKNGIRQPHSLNASSPKIGAAADHDQ